MSATYPIPKFYFQICHHRSGFSGVSILAIGAGNGFFRSNSPLPQKGRFRGRLSSTRSSGAATPYADPRKSDPALWTVAGLRAVTRSLGCSIGCCFAGTLLSPNMNRHRSSRPFAFPRALVAGLCDARVLSSLRRTLCPVQQTHSPLETVH
jgi:hypothetical protein